MCTFSGQESSWAVVWFLKFLKTANAPCLVLMCGFLVEMETSNDMSGNETEVATLGGGCFWCTEGVFKEIEGVKQVVPGYSGGTLVNPSYEQVSTGTTGHAEVVQVHFDPEVLSFRDVLEIFFATHDPTTMNRQGADVGTQYRSVVFYHNSEQKVVAERLIAEYNSGNVFGSPVVTSVEPFTAFYPAEDYHRDYYRRNPMQPYCRAVISPKVAKLRKKLVGRLRKS